MDEQYMQYYDMINAQQQANNAWSAEQAQRAMDYQERMSNTAHQREVADLKAAGLNPVLSAGGSGASTTSGVAAQAGNENVSALYGLVSKVIDQNIEQAKAMQTSAKAASGGSGSYNPVAADGDTNNWDLFTDNPLVNVLEDWLYRKFGLKQDDVDKALSFLGDTGKTLFDYLNSNAKNIKQATEGQKRYLTEMSKLLSLDQGTRQNAKEFLQADLNKNGYLDQKELAQFYNKYGKVPGNNTSQVPNKYQDAKVKGNPYPYQNTGTAGGNGNRRMVTK